MGSWHPLANLRDYVSQHPPGVTFFVCLLTLALSLICLGSYGHTHTLPNPDDKHDWNHLLASLSSLRLCEPPPTDQPVSIPPIGQKTGGTSLANSSQTPPTVTHLSLQVPLVLRQLSPASQSLTEDLALQTTLLARHLGISGNATVNVTLQVFPQPAGGDALTCLIVSAPSHILPLAPLPPQCPTNEKTVAPVKVVEARQLTTASHTCYSLKSTYDPALAAVLTQEQKGVAGRHLEQVSVFLLGVCVLLCLSSTVSHSRRQGNGPDLHRTLIDS